MTTQLQFLLISVADWMSQHQQAVIEYLQEENRILLEQLGGKPKRFTDAQRIRLARKAKRVGRRRLGKLATLVTPESATLSPCPRSLSLRPFSTNIPLRHRAEFVRMNILASRDYLHGYIQCWNGRRRLIPACSPALTAFTLKKRKVESVSHH